MRRIPMFLALLLLTGCNTETGPQGRPGADGEDGQDAGEVILPPMFTMPADASQCPHGGTVIVLGANQQVVCNGAPGGSCAVSQVDTGALITCADGTVALVTNGSDGNTVVQVIVVPGGKKGKDSHEGK